MRTVILIIVIVCVGVIAAAALAATIFIAANWAPERSVAELQGRWGLPPSIFIDVDGLKVHVRDEGPANDARPIVLLHGSGSSLQAWDGWTDALKKDRRVIRFDLAGFGLTGPSTHGNYSAEDDVRLVIGVLDKLGVAQCVLGGNSLGGAIAWRTALVYPERVERLILVDAGGYPSKAISLPLGVQLLRLPLISSLVEHTLPRFLVEQGFRNIYGDPDKVTQEQIERSIDLTQRAGNRRALIKRARQRQPGFMAERIPTLTLPTLIIWGGRDRLIPPADGERFHREIAGSKLVVFNDLGHAPEEEDPAGSVAAVREFLGLQH